MIIRGTVPMCMSQYERMFSTTRVPGKELDSLEHDDLDSATHVMILRKGNFYALEVYNKNGSPITAPELEMQVPHHLPSGTEKHIITAAFVF